MTYRVIQWATGLVGQEAIKGIVAHPELELVGCWVHSDTKVGLDAGDKHQEDNADLGKILKSMVEGKISSPIPSTT